MVKVVRKPKCYGNCLDLKQQSIIRLLLCTCTIHYYSFFSDITNIALVFNASLETLGIGKILLSINALSNILPSMCETDL